MAKAHEKEMNKLVQIFLSNAQDIDKRLESRDGKRISIREILLTLVVENTLRNIHEVIANVIHPEHHDFLSLPETRIELIGRQSHVDSAQAKIYATYADEYLENPQGGEDEADEGDGLPPLKKQTRRIPPKLSYSAVATKTIKRSQAPQVAEEERKVNK
jgi:hypothetical protein